MHMPLPVLGLLLVAGLAACNGTDGTGTTAGTGSAAPQPPATTPTTTPTTSDPAAMTPTPSPTPSERAGEPARFATITLGAGCFWCIEAVLEQVEGVIEVESGYMGGDVPNPTYEQVCTGTTNHAEVVKVVFDPKLLPLENLLDWFWRAHDPTTLNRQGADIGTQYRSAVFCESNEQVEAVQRSRDAAQPTFRNPIVTQIARAATFYPAEAYHQDYYRNNPNQGYCRAVIAPKLDKLKLKK